MASAECKSKADWMSTCPGMSKVPLGEFCFPGSHDSGAFQAPFFSFVTTEPIVPQVEQIITGWTVAQPGAEIHTQLLNGVRFLDFRVANFPSRDAAGKCEPQYYFVHTFAIGRLDDGLCQLQQFLKDHPSEVIVLKLKTYADKLHDISQVGIQDFVVKYLGPFLYDGELDLTSLTLDKVRKQGKQVIAMYNTSDLKTQHGIYLLQDVIFTPPFKSIDKPAEKQAYFQKQLQDFDKGGRRGKVLFQLEYTLTETAFDVISWGIENKHVTLKTLADEMNPTLENFVMKQLTREERNTINVITNDDQMNSDNVSVAIQLIAERVDAKTPVPRPIEAPQAQEEDEKGE